MAHHISTVNSGITSVFFDLPLLKSSAGLAFISAESTSKSDSQDFYNGDFITQDTNFNIELPSIPVKGSIKHSSSIVGVLILLVLFLFAIMVLIASI